jgi:hypothetical protein
MMTFVAIICILLIAMFVYFRQRMLVCEEKLSLLTETVETIAGITRTSLTSLPSLPEPTDPIYECSESESDDDSDDGTDSSVSVKSYTPVKYENKEATELVNELVTELCDVFSKTNVSDDESEIEPNELVVKKIEVDLYNSMSVKELKEKVTELGGPKLKTKKELVDFLKTEIKSNVEV